MLISSPRHRPEDLELWKEYEEADKAHILSNGFFSRVAICQNKIKEFHRREKPHYVSVSWGKDSVVLLHLFRAQKYSPKVIYIRQLDNENPESIGVRDVFLKMFPNTDYKEISYSYKDSDSSWYNKKGLPVKWFQVLRELQKTHGCHVTGIRADESGKRKKRCQIFGDETIFSFAPLSKLTCSDVFAYLHLYNLPIHPNYAMMGGGFWPRERIRVTAIGNKEGQEFGRAEWEREYYGDILNRLAKG